MLNVKIEIGGNVESFDIAENDVERFKQKYLDTVSYTHLTLPTKA